MTPATMNTHRDNSFLTAGDRQTFPFWSLSAASRLAPNSRFEQAHFLGHVLPCLLAGLDPTSPNAMDPQKNYQSNDAPPIAPSASMRTKC